MAAAWVSSLIFLVTIVVLLTDWVHRTIVVWVGAAVMLAVAVVTVAFPSTTRFSQIW